MIKTLKVIVHKIKEIPVDKMFNDYPEVGSDSQLPVPGKIGAVHTVAVLDRSSVIHSNVKLVQPASRRHVVVPAITATYTTEDKKDEFDETDVISLIKFFQAVFPDEYYTVQIYHDIKNVKIDEYYRYQCWQGMVTRTRGVMNVAKYGDSPTIIVPSDDHTAIMEVYSPELADAIGNLVSLIGGWFDPVDPADDIGYIRKDEPGFLSLNMHINPRQRQS